MSPGRRQVPHHQEPVVIRRAVGALVPRGAPVRVGYVVDPAGLWLDLDVPGEALGLRRAVGALVTRGAPVRVGYVVDPAGLWLDPDVPGEALGLACWARSTRTAPV